MFLNLHGDKVLQHTAALFYAFGTAVGGALAPLLFGILIQSGKPLEVFSGDLLGAALMAAADVSAIFFGVDAERKPLEHVARPLSSVEEAAVGPA